MSTSDTQDRLDQESRLVQGTVVGDRFVIKRFLAEGGMGRVYVAEQLPMRRKVALKVMHKVLSQDERAVRRFFREAVVISKLQHPNTITLFDYGESAGGALYIAMEYLDGLTLKEVIAHEGTLGVERVARIISQVGLSLAEAHRKGVIHRDLKPDNVFVRDVDGQPDFVKVIDFGIAQLLTHDSQSRITQAGFVCGTPEYMSPEQARGDDLDGRSDLYSLGVMTFELLEGRLPYTGETALAIVLKHQTGPVPLISASFPEPLRQYVAQLMATDPGDRPASAEQALQALESVLPDGVALPGLSLRPSSPRARQTVPAGLAADRPLASTGLDTAELAETLHDGSNGLARASAEGSTVQTDSAGGVPRHRRRWLLVAVLLGSLVGAGLLVATSQNTHSPVRDSSAAAELVTRPNEPLTQPADDTPGTGRATPEPPVQAASDSVSRPVTVTLETSPPGARIHIANAYAGVSPYPLTGAAGQVVDLLITLDGYEDLRLSETLATEHDGDRLGPFELTPLPARLHVTTTPEGAEVIDVDADEAWGPTDLVHEVPRGNRPIHLELRHRGYRTAVEEIVPAERDVYLHVRLEREHRSSSTTDEEPREHEDPSEQSPFGGTVD